ncbi:allophanate hydrolase subunit 1 [Pseudonocardia eucalypti]|uniref:Allophanate hydrolase subunit 1 n=1 Tax=Pseudonocardia eucalypti TaxID=648755 RepID=A0ABP9R996_9PSEU|nr:KipI family sensor histidine kinase inhibitor [Pseudonocardia eucalypti]
MHILRCGAEAVLVELDDREQVLGLRAALREAGPDGLLEVVPGARTVLVRFDPALTGLARLRELLEKLPLSVREDAEPDEVVVPVRYDGADLADVAELTGLTVPEVIARHIQGEYRVAFCGFAPGFAYITGLDRRLHVPRRDSPRTSVPTGSVALADEYTGIYPSPSPGGWRLIGRTELRLWDLDRDPPTLLVPGTRVRFEEAG